MAGADSAKLKIEWAKKHIGHLNAAIKALGETKPYRIAHKYEPETRKLVMYLAEMKPVPPHVPLIIGDAVNNLRSALEHLAYAIVSKHGTVTEKTGFPIYNAVPAANPNDYKALLERKVDRIPPGIVAAIDAFQPYKGGNETFLALAELNNSDKHKLITTVGTILKGIDVAPVVRRMMSEKFGKDVKLRTLRINAPAGGPTLKVGDALYIGGPDEKPYEDMEVTFAIAFVEPKIVESQSVLKTLGEMTNLVEKVVTTLEGYC